jgi:hypothetical protein
MSYELCEMKHYIHLNFNGENFMKIVPEMTSVDFWKKESLKYKKFISN